MLVFGASISNIISAEDAIHFALSWSLATSHSLWLDSAVYAGAPYTAQVAGHTISALPTGLSFFGFGLLTLGQIIYPIDPAVIGAIIATYFSCIVGALASVLFFKTARMFGSKESAAFLAVVFAFGTGIWLYSRIYLPEGLATLLGIASLYCLLKTKYGGETEAQTGQAIGLALLSGILLGLTIFVDNMAVFLILPILVYITLFNPSRINRAVVLLAFIFGLVLGVLPLAYYDLFTTGNVFTAPYGLLALGGLEPSAYTYQFAHGLFETILSPSSGILFFTPFVVISLVGLFYFVRQRGPELFLFVGLFLSILIPFTLQVQSTYLHNTTGPSELVLVIPYALLPAISALDRFRANIAFILASFALAAASVLINGIVALTDPVFGVASNLLPPQSGAMSTSPLLSTNIPLFLSHSYLTWWSFYDQPLLYALVVLALPLCALIAYSIRMRTKSMAKELF